MQWEKAQVVTEDKIWTEVQKKEGEWEGAEEKDKGDEWGGSVKDFLSSLID